MRKDFVEELNNDIAQFNRLQKSIQDRVKRLKWKYGIPTERSLRDYFALGTKMQTLESFMSQFDLPVWSFASELEESGYGDYIDGSLDIECNALYALIVGAKDPSLAFKQIY